MGNHSWLLISLSNSSARMIKRMVLQLEVGEFDSSPYDNSVFSAALASWCWCRARCHPGQRAAYFHAFADQLCRESRVTFPKSHLLWLNTSASPERDGQVLSVRGCHPFLSCQPELSVPTKSVSRGAAKEDRARLLGTGLSSYWGAWCGNMRLALGRQGQS